MEPENELAGTPWYSTYKKKQQEKQHNMENV
jgi:hypothetical protein